MVLDRLRHGRPHRRRGRHDRPHRRCDRRGRHGRHGRRGRTFVVAVHQDMQRDAFWKGNAVMPSSSTWRPIQRPPRGGRLLASSFRTSCRF